MTEPTADAPSQRFARETGLAADIASLVEPTLEGLGFRLVRVQVSGREGQTVQIMAERLDGTMSIDDCEDVSRQLSPLLDAHDPLPGSYRLEVSSPGIDRPLVRASDFIDWAGHEAKITLKTAMGSRKRLRGTIEGLEDGKVRLSAPTDQGEVERLSIPVDDVAEAKLVLTDDLVRDALRRAKKAQKSAGGEEPRQEN
jgi:ribosome maturation factor RimP